MSGGSYLEEPGYLDDQTRQQLHDLVASVAPQDVRGLGDDQQVALPPDWIRLPILGIAVQKKTLIILGIIAAVIAVYFLTKKRRKTNPKRDDRGRYSDEPAGE